MPTRLARHIANADPKIRRVFDQWKGTAALDSPLEKNQDLKAVLLEETPWVRQALKESEARRNVGILFDANRLNEELGRGLRKLVEMQEAGRILAVVPGRSPQRLHHALHHDRVRTPAASGCRDRCRSRLSGRSRGWTRGLTNSTVRSWRTATRTRTTSARPSRCTCTVAASSWTISRSRRNARRPSITSSVRRGSTGPSWAAGSRRRTWPSP